MDPETPDADRPPSSRLPPQATMGLLDYLTTHALDEDYAFVSEQQDRGGPSRGARRRIGVIGALVLGLFAVIVVTAAAQTARNSSTDEQNRRDLAAQVDSARSRLEAQRERVDELQLQVSGLQRRQLEGDTSAQGLLGTIQLLSTLTGTVPVQGPGVRIVADDAPGATEVRNQVLDSDLQRLVNGLWQAGAEAIAVNGQRLTNLSTIRLAGSAITVNSTSLSRPYVVTALGDPDTLPARFAETTSGQAWLDLQREVGLRLEITPVSSLRLPAAEVSLRYANKEQTGGGDS